MIVLAYQDNSAAWMFGGKDVILDGEGTGTIDGNGQTFYDARVGHPLAEGLTRF